MIAHDFPPVETFATLLGQGPTASVWYAVRALDRQGSGVLTVPADVLAGLLRVTPRTVVRHLYRGVEAGWFRGVYRVASGVYRVFLASTVAVARRFGLTQLGPSARVPIADLWDWRLLATEIVAEAGQQAARYAKSQELDKARRKALPTAFDLLNHRSSEISTGAIKIRATGKRILYADGATDLLHGVSQLWIGNARGLTERTIQRHMSIRYRDRRQSPRIQKRQVAALVRDEVTGKPLPARQLKAIHQAGYCGSDNLAESKRHFVRQGKIWRAGTCLYACDRVELTSKRRLKYNFRLAVSRPVTVCSHFSG